LNDGTLSYSVTHGDRTVVEEFALGITTASTDFTSELTVESRTDETVSGSYSTTSGSRLSHSYDANLAKLRFTTDDDAAVELDVRASADGAAYRYRIPGDGTVEVTDELSSFAVPGDPDAWAMPFSNDGISTDPGDYNENEWRQVSPSNMSGEYG